MDAKHVGLFSTGRGHIRYPSVDGTSERSSIVISVKLEDHESAVPPIQQVS